MRFKSIRSVLFFVALSIIAAHCFAQNAPAASNARTKETVYRIGNEVTSPKALRITDPKYPKEAKRAKVEGTVVLFAEIGTDGRAHNLRVMRSLGHGLDEAALKTVSKEWRFEPGQKSGQPVRVMLNLEVNFRLDPSSGK